MSRMMSADIAAGCLRSGGVIACPTEGVWGLGCDPCNEAAVLRLLVIKQRDVAKGLILIAANEIQLAPFIAMHALSARQCEQVRATWPGPATWIVPASAAAPRWITGEQAGIAVRVSAHPEVIALCEAFGGALISTSANRSGLPPPRARRDLDPQMLAQLDGVLVGETGSLAQPTPIRDARSGTLLRD